MVEVGSGAKREQNKYSVVRKDWITVAVGRVPGQLLDVSILPYFDGQRKDSFGT